MAMENEIVILGAARTPMGSMLGQFTNVSATELGAAAIKAAVERSGVGVDEISSVIMGCVLSAGLGQAPARQASIGAGIPYGVGAATVNKMCASGMKALMLAHDGICAGSYDVMVAGGMESMTNAPYLLTKARQGYRLGHGEIKDQLFLDGLEDAYDKGKLMGCFAEETAKKYQFGREAQDQFAITSAERAHAAQAQGLFSTEITSVSYKTKKGEVTVSQDELPSKEKIAKIPTLRPAFQKDGTVTAANSSSISDGAAALVLTSGSVAQQKGFKPIARIVAHSTFSQEPAWFTTAPIGAIKQLFTKTGWAVNDVDLFEINEAFAVVTMAAMHDLDIPHDKVNIHGGACAFGHPIGASGARIVVTLIHALQQKGLQRGVAALCIGGGEATAVAIELIE